MGTNDRADANGACTQVWDSGRLLDLPGVYRGAYITLGASVLSAAALAFL
jgi:hypothetical protein